MCICAGILWNLSSKDNLKEKLAKEILPDLTEKILIPLSNKGGQEGTELTPSESEIFYNTTGCLRCSSQICVCPCGLVILDTCSLLSITGQSNVLTELYWLSDLFLVTFPGI